MSTNFMKKLKKFITNLFSDKLYLNNCSTIKKMQYEEVPEIYDCNYNQSETTSMTDTVVKIDVPLARDEIRFPKEKWKTFLSFLMLSFNMILATVSLALVHDRVPDKETYGPLPDIVLDNLNPVSWALDVSEILIMISTYSCVVLITFHKHRFIVMRRVFIVMSVLYFMRSITMYVTVLPISNPAYFCSPKSNTTTALDIAKRSLYLLSGFGLSINGKHVYCGDFIYSGHTVMLVLGYLIIVEYSPKKFYIVHWIAWMVSIVGVLMVLIAHGHYTIDVLIAYYVTTRLFWTYHTLANNSLLLKQNGYNYIGREWWFVLFKYFEKNVRGPIPMQYEMPISYPRRLLSKMPNRES